MLTHLRCVAVWCTIMVKLQAYYEYHGVLVTDKLRGCLTLLALGGGHFGYVAEVEGPHRHCENTVVSKKLLELKQLCHKQIKVVHMCIFIFCI